MICGFGALSARASVSRVVVAFGLGIASHALLDMIPHGDYATLSRSAIVAVVSVEVFATIALAWLLLRSRRVPGWRTALPAGVVGASIPDIKFLAPFFPAPLATWIEVTANRFHGPFHAPPAPLLLEISAELACTVSLLGGLVFLARRLPTRHPAR
ncbi:MAG TPA: hypothetical protein VFZ73_03885 [Gemmatimonadaceae bacterium]